MLKRDLAALGLRTNSEHERDAEEYWRDLEMPRSCAAEVGAPRGRSSRPGQVCRNATPSSLKFFLPSIAALTHEGVVSR